MVITTRELAALATDVATVLPSSGQIQRATTSSDGAGGRTRSFSTVATVACRITPHSMDEQELVTNDRFKDKEPFRVAFPAGTDVRLGDRVVVSGRTLSVEAVRSPRSVEVERVTFCVEAAA